MDERQPIEVVLDVAVEAAADEADAAFAQRVLTQAVEMQRADLPTHTLAVYISLVLTDDDGIAALNREHRGVDAPTDVLSFPQFDAPLRQNAPLLLGDIVISVERAAAQAQEYGHSRARELGFLLVHGLLHLLAYDHETLADSTTMETRQTTVLDALGLTRDAAP